MKGVIKVKENSYPAYYGILTANVRYNDQLSMSEKVMFTEITALSNANGYCSARNKYFAELYDKSEKTISLWIKHLRDCGFIHIEYKRRGAEVVLRKIYPTPEHELQKCKSTNYKNVTGTDYKNVKENNTSTNNTSINKLSSYVLTFYENNIGMISPWLREDIEDEVKDWNEINNDEAERIIVEALKNAIGAQARNKWKYAKSILSSWKERNIKSLSDIEVSDKQHQREIQAKYSHPRYSNRPHIEEKVPNWDQKPQERTDSGQATSDIKNLMTRINQKIKNNKEDEENE